MNPYKIMVVDDEIAFREAIEEYLATYGYQVYHAKDGKECLDKIQSILPDLILMDIAMPKVDGIAAAKEIKRTASLSHIPIIFVSNLDDPNVKYDGFEVGADDYVTKPFNKTELIARVQAVLRRGKKYKHIIGTLEGDLDKINLMELLQVLFTGRKTARVEFENFDSELLIQNGALFHARIDFFYGVQAIERIFFLEEGRFSVEFDIDLTEYTRDESLVSFHIMKVLVAVDDVQNILNEITKENPMVTIDPDIDYYPTIKKLQQISPLPLKKLVALIKGEDLKENATLVVEAYKEGKIWKS